MKVNVLTALSNHRLNLCEDMGDVSSTRYAFRPKLCDTLAVHLYVMNYFLHYFQLHCTL